VKRSSALLRELMEAEPSHQLRRVREPRFQSLALLDWLLEQSHEHQLSNPAHAVQLARLAIRLGTGFRETAAARDRTEAVAALSRAFCLGANALRLDSKLSAAENLLTRGSLVLTDSLERAFYCRTLAVLRWEQARTDEARALLAYAAGLYAREGVEREASLCRSAVPMRWAPSAGAGRDSTARQDPSSLCAWGWPSSPPWPRTDSPSGRGRFWRRPGSSPLP